jgi:beta-glucosidase
VIGGGVIFLDGGPSDAAVVKVACQDSTEQLLYTDGIGLDISSAGGPMQGKSAYTPNPAVAAQAQQIVSGMTITQLANQMRGTPYGTATMQQFNDIYRTADDPVAGVKGLQNRDGPRGVCLQQPQFTGGPTNATPISYGPNGIGYSTAFPVASARASTWDLDLENQVGQDIGDEILASGNTMVFAPVVNILRHPAWGRSQETYGEDSFLLGRMGSAFVEGVQQYVPACVKHYAANNIERGRENLNAVMDEQTLHEVYGRHFEMIVKEAGVACVMAAYNEVNGTKSTLSTELLTNMLRGTFGFKGIILSDFWAMPPFRSVQTPAQQATIAQQGLAAGLDLELPWALNYSQLESIAAGSPATVQQLQASATRIIAQKLRFNIATPGSTANLGLEKSTSVLTATGISNMAHLADAQQVALEGMVLLKNDHRTLPIDTTTVKTVAVIGAQAPWMLTGTGESGTDNLPIDPRIGDLGSSRVLTDPTLMIGPLAGIRSAAPAGVTVISGNDPGAAANADFIVLVTGLTQSDEGEDFTGASDRDDGMGHPNFELDPKMNTGMQDDLVMQVAALGKPMVVVNESGSAVNMPWIDSVPAVVQAWYPGAWGGAALGDLLFGNANFSGKLPITWPVSQDDEPPFNTGPANNGATTMDYYLGYRYFDHNQITPLFAFGHGLSYTTFAYSNLGVPCSTVTKSGVINVTADVTNIGTVAGSEVAFLFVSYPQTQARRSVKELKGFIRTPAIAPGQTAQLTIPLRVIDLKYWDTNIDPAGWVVESGPVEIMVGGSSDSLPLSDTVTVQ